MQSDQLILFVVWVRENSWNNNCIFLFNILADKVVIHFIYKDKPNGIIALFALQIYFNNNIWLLLHTLNESKVSLISDV